MIRHLIAAAALCAAVAAPAAAEDRPPMKYPLMYKFQTDRAQAKGRGEIFADYRITVAEVVRQYGMTDRAQAPQA